MTSTSKVAPKSPEVLEVISSEPEKSLLTISVSAPYSLTVERDRQVFSDAVHYCMILLKQSKRFTDQRSEHLSLEATLMGHEMFERIISVNAQMDVEPQDEIITHSGQPLQNKIKQEPESDDKQTSSIGEEKLLTNIKQEIVDRDSTMKETDEKSDGNEQQKQLQRQQQQQGKLQPKRSRLSMSGMFVEIPRESMQDFLRYTKSHYDDISGLNNDGTQLPLSPASISGGDYWNDDSKAGRGKPGRKVGSHITPLSFEMKQKVVSLATTNPDWSLQKLRIESGVKIRNTHQVTLWKRQIEEGGTRTDKCNRVNTLTFEKILEAEEKLQLITLDDIHQWAIQSAKDVYGANFKFKPGNYWTKNFKKLYNLHWNPVINSFIHSDNKEVIKDALKTTKKKSNVRSNRGNKSKAQK